MGVPVLRDNRDFRLLWGAGLISALGSQFAAVAMPLTVLAVTGSPAAAGLLGSVSLACTLLCAIPGGAIADAFERRRVLIVCACGALAASAALAGLVLLVARPPLILLIALSAATAILSSAEAPAVSAMLVAVVPAGDLGAATARNQSRGAAARLAGPLLGAALYGLGRDVTFLVLAAGEAMSLCCVLAIRTRSRPPRTGRNWFDRRELSRGLVFVWRHPELRTPLLIFGCVLNAAFGAAMLAAVAVGAHADPSGRLNGLMSALAGAGSLIGGLVAARLPVQRRLRAMLVATCCVATACVGVLAVLPPYLLGAAFALCMATSALGNVAFMTLLLRRASRDVLGRVSSAAMVLSMVTQPIGPAAGGYLLQRTGASATFLLLAGAGAGCSAIAVLAPSLRALAPAATAGPAMADASLRSPSAGVTRSRG
jgi:MFS family permease